MESLEGINLKDVASDILCEFLEVAFHYVLYIREVYPQVLFERRRKYNVPVWMCIHPELNKYIRDVLVGAKMLMRKGAMDKVILAINNKDDEQVERFTFYLQELSEVALREDGHLLQLESDLRATMMKIGTCDAILKPNPPECTFRVYIHTSQVAAASMEQQQEFTWVSADSAATQSYSKTSTVPLKTISSSVVKMQLLVEECSSK